MFENLKEKLKLRKNSGEWKKDAMEDIEKEQKEAYIDAYREIKIEEAKQKAIDDAKHKGGFFNGLRKFIRPYTPEELARLAPKPIITKETRGFYNKEEN